MPLYSHREGPRQVLLACLAGGVSSLFLAGCAGSAPAGVTTVQAEGTLKAPAWRALPEHRLLAEASTFEASAIGAGGDTPLSAVAFTRLVLREDAARIFDDLARQERLVARLYGVKGLWFVDRERYRREVASLAERGEDVATMHGCIVGEVPVRELARVAPARDLDDWSSPASLFLAGAEWLEDADPRDGDAAKWRATLLDPMASKSHRLWAARTLAYSLDGPGLALLLESLPRLEQELQDDVLELLVDVPPWSRGALESLGTALDSQEPVVLDGVTRAMCGLSRFPQSLPACRRMMPALRRAIAALDEPRRGELAKLLDVAASEGLLRE